MKKASTPDKTIVVAFGRFQPPTSGHQVLVDKVIEVAKKSGADHAMFASRTNDPKKNPLTANQKYTYLKKFFPEGNFVNDSKIKTPVDMIYWLADKGYAHVVLVSGEDRQGNYKMFSDFMKPGTKNRLNLKSFKTHEAGKRDENARGITGVSASKIRAAAADNNLALFSKGMPRNANKKDIKALFRDLKSGMKLQEELDFQSIFHSSAIRLIESDKHKRRSPTPGQTGGFSKHNKKFPIPPCKIDEDLKYWLTSRWLP